MSQRTPRIRITHRYAAAYAAGATAIAAVLVLTVSANAAPAAPSSTGASTAAGASIDGATLPDRIGARAAVTQMVTVSSPVWSTQQATLRAWRRGQSGHWHLVRGPLSVVIGYHGWVRGAQRVQSTGTTPAGRYRLPYAFGRLADPGAEIAYRRFDNSDWWPYEPRDPATYNVWQWHKAATSRWRRDKAEHLWDYQDQYAYGVVIGFNLPGGIRYSHRRGQWVADHRADTRRGGGIFLHVRGSGATAGCVAMRRAQLRWLIRWLSPTAHAQIVMGPYRYLTTL